MHAIEKSIFSGSTFLKVLFRETLLALKKLCYRAHGDEVRH
jgi:hypothetical protein